MIRYNDAGLRNVWLQNGYAEKRTAYGKGLVIEDVEGLAHAVCSATTSRLLRCGKSAATCRYGRIATCV